MKKFQTLALLGAVALGLATAGAAHANGKPLISKVSAEEVFPNPCTGETITLTGEFLIILHQTEDAAGGFHETFTLIPRSGPTTGESGTRYRDVGQHSDSFNTGPGRATTFSFAVTFNVISAGGADNFIGKGKIHLTVTPNGDVTAEFEEIGFECRG